MAEGNSGVALVQQMESGCSNDIAAANHNGILAFNLYTSRSNELENALGCTRDKVGHGPQLCQTTNVGGMEAAHTQKERKRFSNE